MSGGSRLFKGDGMAWRREQADILDHAKKLGYDRAGGSIISQTDNKQDWESWRNKFVDWKNKNVALEPQGKAFWQQRPKPKSKPKAPSAPTQIGPSPAQEAAERNVYFPMLVPEYSAPQALDYSAYTSMSPFGGQGGLLYQPGTQQYREAFPISDNILSYQPPQLGLPQVTYSNPIVLGLIEEGLGGGGGGKKTPKDEKTSDASDDQRGGRYGDRNVFAGAEATGSITAGVVPVQTFGLIPSDDIEGISTVSDMAGWGGIGIPGGGAPSSGGSSGVGPGGIGGGVGKGY
ncbi:MAG: hypothetical protein GWN13_21240 [Phycisphaerae bacterium]|nr:hypothetical protein [Phycisphaerae bacterium]